MTSRCWTTTSPRQKVTGFSAQTGLPLRVGLLIDASSSIRERFKFEQDAAAEFLASIIRPKQDQAFVMGFDNSHEITQDFTNDSGLLAKGVHMLRPGGGTALLRRGLCGVQAQAMAHERPGSRCARRSSSSATATIIRAS